MCLNLLKRFVIIRNIKRGSFIAIYGFNQILDTTSAILRGLFTNTPCPVRDIHL